MQIQLNAMHSGEFVMQPIDAPEYSSRFWFEGGLWYASGNDSTGMVYYLFGSDSSRLWAAGYSFPENKIDVSRFILQQYGEPKLQRLDFKIVHFEPFDDKLYFKLIFNRDTEQIKFEVNGVALETAAPVDFQEIKYIGYFARHMKLTMEPFKFDGD